MRLRMWWLILVVLCFEVFWLQTGAAQAAWTVERAVAPKNFGNLFNPRGIALDSAGHPHIAYGGDNLYHAYHDGSVWRYETIPDWSQAIGNYTSIAIDDSDRIHISCYNEDTGQLLYATNASGSWAIEEVTTIGAGRYSCIALDSSGHAHISSTDASSGKMVYTTNASGVWTSTVIAAGGQYSSIVVDSSGTVHISYGISNLFYANNATGAWSTTTVDSTASSGSYNCLDVDSAGKVHISYWVAGVVDNVRYATNATGVWVIDTVDRVGGEYTSLVIDSADKVHISYQDTDNWDLKYATNATGAWVLTSIDTTGMTGFATSLALDSSDKAHISYLNQNTNELRYATNASGSWTAETVDTRWVVDNTDMPIAVDSAGKAHVTFRDVRNQRLLYATNRSGAWVSQVVDGGAVDVGDYSSVAVDSADKVHVAYSDWDNDDLKYATNATGTWVPQIADNGISVGEQCSLALDSSDKAHISYCDGDNLNLKYATNASGSWVTTTVDATGNLDYDDTAIALDSGGRVHISYLDSSNYNLMYATNASGTWATYVIDASNSVWYYTSIAVDSAGKVHISYHADALMYATNASGAWVLQTVEAGFGSGRYNSIAVDALDRVHISYDYYNGMNYDLKHATNSSGTWVAEIVDSEGSVGENCSLTVDGFGRMHISYYDDRNEDLKYAFSDALLHTLTVAVSPSGGGAVTASGINCPGDCSQPYPSGVSVTLTAVPGTGYVFDHWTGSLTGTANPASVVMSADRTVTAVFAPGPSEAYTVALPSGTRVEDYRIVSMCLQPADPRPSAVLGSQIGTYDPTQMRIGYWNADLQAYQEYPFSDSIEPGEAGWFLFRNGKSLTVRGEATPTDIGPMGLEGYGVVIGPGWNLVGNPFLQSVDVDGLIVEEQDGSYAYLTSSANAITQRVFWSYGGGGYGPAYTLSVAQGGWIKKLTPGWGYVFFPTGQAIPDRASEPMIVPDDLERPPAPPAGFDAPSQSAGGGGGGCFIGVLLD